MDKRLFFVLNRARHRINKYINTKLQKNFGITSVQAAAILFLEQKESAFLKEMSSGLDMNSSAVTTLAQRLEKKGYTTKKRAETDKRAFRINLTAKGKKTAEEIKPFVNDFNENFTNNFSKEEIDSVIRFLNFSIDLFDKKNEEEQKNDPAGV
ncbi:MAG: MarR family winged helix-turn-helix transcriptional regulator [Thermodesulfobacteriota bacterium]